MPAVYTVPWGNGRSATVRYEPNNVDHTLADFLSTRTIVAMDVETTGFNIGADTFEVRTIQIGDEDGALVFPNAGDDITKAVNILLESGVTVVTHKGVYDWVSLGTMFGPFDMAQTNIEDTYILARHWDPRGKGDGPGAIGHSMEALLAEYVSEDDAADVKALATKGAKALGITKGEYFTTVPIDDDNYVKYAGMDTVFTMALHGKLLKNLHSTGVHSFERIQGDYVEMKEAIRMGVRGMRVDVPYLTELRTKLEEEEKAAKKRALEEFGVTAIGSPKQLYDAFIEAGADPATFSRTPAGNPQVNAKKLKELGAEGFELANVVQEGKRAQKWRKSYVDQIMSCAQGVDRIHPQINVYGARTGRYSVANPPLQQLPSDTDMIRRAFIADEGHAIVSVDYSGQELRLAAALSGDENMVRDFQSGVNPMKKLAATVFGDDYSPSEYKRTKICIYGTQYGGGVATIARQTNLPESQVAEIRNAWYALYPGIKTHANRLSNTARTQGYIRGMADRLLPLDPGFEYAASNAEFQNGGREMMGRAVRTMRPDIRDMVLLQVHDELVFQVPASMITADGKETLPSFSDPVREAMESTIRGIEFPVEIEVCGPSWAGHYS